MSLLLVPWPKRVDPSQFRRSGDSTSVESTGKRALSSEKFGFFEYAPKGEEAENEDDPDGFERYVFRLLEAARERVGHIDGIVLPELACTHERLAKLAWRLLYSDEHGGADGWGPLHLIIGGVLQRVPGGLPYSELAHDCLPENVASVYMRTPGHSGRPRKTDAEKDEKKRPKLGEFNALWYRQQQPKHHRWHITGGQVVQYGLVQRSTRS